MEEKRAIFFFFFLSLGSSPSSGLGKSSELSSGSLAFLVCLETGCQVQFHSNYSSVKIINFSSQCCPLCTTVSRYSSKEPENFGGKFGLNPSGRGSRTWKACFAFQMGKRNWGLYWNLGFKLETGWAGNRWRGVLLTGSRPPTRNSPSLPPEWESPDSRRFFMLRSYCSPSQIPFKTAFPCSLLPTYLANLI